MDDVVGRPRLLLVDRFSALFRVQTDFVEDSSQEPVQNVFVTRRANDIRAKIYITIIAFIVGESDFIDAVSFLGADDDDLCDREGRRRRFPERFFRNEVVEILASFVSSFVLSSSCVQGLVAPAEKARGSGTTASLVQLRKVLLQSDEFRFVR